jgi:tetratricopeptide (TPR) repeat protein
VKRRAGFLGIVLAAAATQAGAGYDDGLAYFKGGKLAEAAAEFQEAVDADASDDRGWFLLAQCLREMGRPNETERALERAIRVRPERPEYRHALSLVLRDLGRPAEAVAEAAEGLRRADSPRAVYALHVALAAALGDLGRWREAAAELERARAVRSDPALLDLLGRAYFALGDDARAVAAWAEAEVRDPADAKRLRLVVEAFLRAAAGAPDSGAKRGAYLRALELANRYRDGRPGDVDALHLVGRAALGAGRLDDAESAFRRVLAEEPRHCFALVNLGRVLLAREEFAAAERTLQRAAACAPRLGVVHETLGALWLVNGRDAQAARAFRRAMSLDPTPTAAAGLEEARRRVGVAPEGEDLQVPVGAGERRPR